MKNIIPNEYLKNTKFFNHDENEIDLSIELEKFEKHVLKESAEDEIMLAYRLNNDKEVSIIWTTNYVLFSTQGMLGQSYLGWMPRNPHLDDLK